MNTELMNDKANNATEENVATLLPNVGLNGKPMIGKGVNSEYENEIMDDVNNTEDSLSLSEAVSDYINDPDMTYTDLVEEGVKDAVLNFKTKLNIDRQIRKCALDIAITKAKIKVAGIRKYDSKKLINLKRELVYLQKKMVSLKKGLSPVETSEIKKIEKLADKEAEKEIKESVEVVEEKQISDKSAVDFYDSANKVLDNIRKDINDLSSQRLKLKSELSKTKDINEKKQLVDKIKGLEKRISDMKKNLSSREETIKNRAKDLDSQNTSKSGVKTMRHIIKPAYESEEVETFEAANMEDEIKPIVAELNRKGYKVKYSSPGHTKLRKKEDQEPDGVYHGKLYSDARIMFQDKYNFPKAPKGWTWRLVDGCSYLDIVPRTYSDDNGTPDDAFKKWKNEYMNSLREFVKELPEKDSKKVEESVHVLYDEFLVDMFESFNVSEKTEEENLKDANNALIEEMNKLL